MDVKWTNEAEAWLKEISDYIARDSPQRSEAFILRLIRATDRLGAFPLSGKVLQLDERYRVIIISGYQIIYRVTADRVMVAAVLSPGLQIETALNRRWD